jgi:nitrous oxidase accessory protein
MAGALTLPQAGLARTLAAAPGQAVEMLAAAAPGDTVVLARGVHPGPLRVTRALTLRGAPGAVVDGGGVGRVIEVAASGVAVQDLEVVRSGPRVLTVDAGLYVGPGGGVHLRRLRLRDVLYGIYAERHAGLVIEDCRLVGRVAPRQEIGEGNGINLWRCDAARLAGNQVERFLDGVYLSFAHQARVEGNLLRRCGRYGLHTMYCQGTHLTLNTFTENLAGCAIMFTNHLEATGNAFVHNRGPRTYGLLLRDCSGGLFAGNRMVDNTVAIFMDNSNRNVLRGNLVQDNGWGVLLFSSCAGNQLFSNDFINNDYPVALDMRRTDNRFDDGRTGNYWSENRPYDLDADGVSDVPYSPVGAFAFLSKRHPDLAVLAKSPAVSALGVAEQVFPALRPSEAVDRFPRVTPAGMSTTASGLAQVRPAWGAAAGFVGLMGMGAAGLAAGRRRG